MKLNLQLLLMSFWLYSCSMLFPQGSAFILMSKEDSCLKFPSKGCDNNEIYEFATTLRILNTYEGSRLEKLEQAIADEIVESKHCKTGYEVLENTLGFFEGGGVNIFLRCLPDPS